MYINDITDGWYLDVEACGSKDGRGVDFSIHNKDDEELGSVFTQDRDSIVKLRDKLNEILDNPYSFGK